jgi:hypothetical protein
MASDLYHQMAKSESNCDSASAIISCAPMKHSDRDVFGGVEGEALRLTLYTEDWEALRMIGAAGRLAIAFALSEAQRAISEENVRLRHPDYDDREVRLAAFKLVIGPKLFREVYPSVDVEP